MAELIDLDALGSHLIDVACELAINADECLIGLARELERRSAAPADRGRVVDSDARRRVDVNTQHRCMRRDAVTIEHEQMVEARRSVRRSRRQLHIEDIGSRIEWDLDEPLIHVDTVCHGTGLHERHAADVIDVDVDHERRADIRGIWRMEDRGPRRKRAGVVVEVRRIVDFGVRVDQRTGRAAACDEHGGVREQQSRRVVHPRHGARRTYMPRARSGIPDFSTCIDANELVVLLAAVSS